MELQSSSPVSEKSEAIHKYIPAEFSIWDAIQHISKPVYIHENGQQMQMVNQEEFLHSGHKKAYIPAISMENLGSSSFKTDYGLTYAYIAGAMANGIASEALVVTMGQAGMMGVFGSGGLDLDTIEQAIINISTRLGTKPWGMNLLHNPFEPDLEDKTVDLFLQHGVSIISAAAYVKLSLPLIRYRLTGIYQDPKGNVIVPNRVIGKVSRQEVAQRFMAPAPHDMIAQLVQRGDITEQQAHMAESVPVAQDITAEADSGGHTDNAPAITMIPTMMALRDQMQATYGYSHALRVGVAGGIATPQSALAAFSMGAAYILTGSINQACQEAGTSDHVRKVLAKTTQADVTMAPAADMFESGVQLQVLKNGTMFPMRASRLYEIYKNNNSIEDIEPNQKKFIEKSVFQNSMETIWEKTVAFWQHRDPQQIEKANSDPKHKMALLFRWYLGKSSRWANTGKQHRLMDFQIWCGPAMGAFNQWVKGSFLEEWKERYAVPIALNILYGAALLQRNALLNQQGFRLEDVHVAPKHATEIEELRL